MDGVRLCDGVWDTDGEYPYEGVDDAVPVEDEVIEREGEVSTGGGDRTFDPLGSPLPSSPQIFSPQHRKPPSSISAHVC